MLFVRLQVYAIGEWQLSKGQVASFFTLIPVLGAIGNLTPHILHEHSLQLNTGDGD